ncbi:MAG: DMT family transporter [Acidobacteria bacterium]|nr:DMT family transporter [Acidobacteriota bacterium]
MRRWLSLTPFDGLLLLMVLIWGANYSVVKTTLREIPPQAFNALRLVIASIVFLIAASIPELRQIVWGRVPLWAWASLALSAVLALNVAYLIWYTSVQRIGNIRTSAYSNIIPLVAMTIAAVALGPPPTRRLRSRCRPTA